MAENFLGEKPVDYKVRDGDRTIKASSENIEKTTANSVENICENIYADIERDFLVRLYPVRNIKH
jgi:hypothetical protein